MRMAYIFLCCALFLIAPVSVHAQRSTGLTLDEYVQGVGGVLIDGKWVVTRKEPTLDDMTTVMVLLLRDGGLQEFDGSLFGMACARKMPVVGFGFFDKNMGNGVKTFEYKIDNQPIRKENWQVLNTVTFISAPITFLKSLIGAKKLIVRGYPIDGPSVEMSFNIERIENVFPIIQNECGWR